MIHPKDGSKAPWLGLGPVAAHPSVVSLMETRPPDTDLMEVRASVVDLMYCLLALEARETNGSTYRTMYQVGTLKALATKVAAECSPGRHPTVHISQ